MCALTRSKAAGVSRLVTLTGPGGVGKTRLAVAAAERLRGRFGAGTVFVPLDSVTDPGLVLAAVGRAAGAGLAGTGSPAEALAETFGDGAWLLILDNLEQVVQAAPDLGELLARCPQLVMLATSRTVLGLRAEREYPVPPLPLPPGPGSVSVAAVAASPAVALFADRARAVRPGFALTEGNAAAVAEICRRLEGLPLAIELAAARTRLLEPAALLARLAASLDALGTGAVDLPERQRTLRATVEWSVGLLADAERSLLEVVAVFTDGWTIRAASAVAGLGEDRALELSEALARHSLIHPGSTGLGSRSRMLETVREFVAGQLAARPDAAEIGRRHAGYYRALAEQADRPLRGTGRGEWLERLQAEAGNLAAAVRWYLAHDPGPLPHLFRILWLFWTQQGLEREAWSWVEQLLPAAGTLDPQARAELAWAAAVLAVDAVDDTAALAARQRLAPLLAGISDPFLHAASQLVMAWTLPITGDFDGALREAAVSLEELRGQDELAFAAMAAFTAGSVEMALGRYDDALGHLVEARELAERSGGDWLAAGSRGGAQHSRECGPWTPITMDMGGSGLQAPPAAWASCLCRLRLLARGPRILPGSVRGDEGLCTPGLDGFPVPQIPPWMVAGSRRVDTAEYGDCDRGQPVALGQRPVQLGAGALPCILGVAARSHPEHGHRHAGELPAMAPEEAVGVAVPAPGIQWRAQHDQVVSGDWLAHGPGWQDHDLRIALAQGSGDRLGHLLGRAVLGRIGHEHVHHAPPGTYLRPAQDRRHRALGPHLRWQLSTASARSARSQWQRALLRPPSATLSRPSRTPADSGAASPDESVTVSDLF